MSLTLIHSVLSTLNLHTTNRGSTHTPGLTFFGEKRRPRFDVQKISRPLIAGHDFIELTRVLKTASDSQACTVAQPKEGESG